MVHVNLPWVGGFNLRGTPSLQNKAHEPLLFTLAVTPSFIKTANRFLRFSASPTQCSNSQTQRIFCKNKIDIWYEPTVSTGLDVLACPLVYKEDAANCLGAVRCDAEAPLQLGWIELPPRPPLLCAFIYIRETNRQEALALHRL